jgi:glycosyltransferase involved in cell wall biosynthesis
MSAERRAPARIAIVTPGTSQFDSRAHRIARSCAAQGDTVTMYARREQGMAAEEHVDGYRIVRVPLQPGDFPETPRSAPTGGTGRIMAGVRRFSRRAWRRVRVAALETGVGHRLELFPMRPRSWAEPLAQVAEPHDIWHGMWAGSLPALSKIRSRLGGRTVYDSRDVYLRSREFDGMPRLQRAFMTAVERRWAKRADAVITVNEAYAGMLVQDLGIARPPVVMNCPDRWDPPDPRPDRIRQLLALPATTRIVLYQGLLITNRGIAQSMHAILDVPDAVLVLMGSGRRDRYGEMAAGRTFAGKVHVIDAVSPADLLSWTASSDIMLMAIQPSTTNHLHTTPQKLWEAMAAGVPVVASDMPGMAAVVKETGCGVVCDPTSPTAIATAIRSLLDDPAAMRAAGERGLAAAHARYNWATQFEVLDGVYAKLLGAAR